jgi:hypothetical protein
MPARAGVSRMYEIVGQQAFLSGETTPTDRFTIIASVGTAPLQDFHAILYKRSRDKSSGSNV